VPQRDIPRCLQLHASGKLRLDALITDRFALGDINAAIDAMRNGSAAGRCLIEVQPL
jgi:Zn-dependent alcohol dehydrogenase